MPAKNLFLFISGLDACSIGVLVDQIAETNGHPESTLHSDLFFPLQDRRGPTLASVATGLWPDQHGVVATEFWEPATNRFEIASGRDRLQPTLWERLALEGSPAIAVGWPYSLPTSPMPGLQVVDAAFGSHLVTLRDVVYPHAVSSGIDLREAWLRSDELPIDVLQAIEPRAAQLTANDARLGLLSSCLAQCVSHHAAFLELISAQPWSLATLHLELPFHLKRLAAASPDGLFAAAPANGLNVLAEMLRAILVATPPEVNIVLAGLPMQAGATGAVCLSGPAINVEQGLIGASALDLAPTLWSLAGYTELRYPGRTLIEALKPEAMEGARFFRETWRPSTAPSPLQAQDALVEQLNPEGFSPRTIHAPENFIAWQQDYYRTLVRSYLARHAYLEALPYVEDYVRAHPDNSESLQVLAEILLHANLFEQALEVAWDVADMTPADDPGPMLLIACAHAGLGDHAKALELLEEVNPAQANVSQQMRMLFVYERLKEWTRALALLDCCQFPPHEDYPILVAALARQALGDHELARDHALAAVSANYGNPRAHEALAHALWALGDQGSAMTAFAASACFAPKRAWPYENLARYGKLARVDQESIDQWEMQASLVRQEEQQLIDNYLAELTDHQPDEDPALPAPPATMAPPGRPLRLIGLTGLTGSGHDRLSARLASAGHRVVDTREHAFWPETLRGERVLEEGVVYILPHGVLRFLPREHSYKIVVCELLPTDITEAWIAESLPEALLSIERETLIELLMREQYFLLQTISKAPNLSLDRVAHDALAKVDLSFLI